MCPVLLRVVSSIQRWLLTTVNCDVNKRNKGHLMPFFEKKINCKCFLLWIIFKEKSEHFFLMIDLGLKWIHRFNHGINWVNIWVYSTRYCDYSKINCECFGLLKKHGLHNAVWYDVLTVTLPSIITISLFPRNMDLIMPIDMTC